MTAVEIAQLLGLLIAATGLAFSGLQTARQRRQLAVNTEQLKSTISQIKHQRREQRVAQIVHLHERLYDDPALQETYYRLERGWIPETPAGPARTPAEARSVEQLDKLLGLFEVAARLRQKELIGIDELDLIAYEFLTVHQNKGIQAYIQEVERSNVASRGMKIVPVKAFRGVGDELQREYRYEPIPPYPHQPWKFLVVDEKEWLLPDGIRVDRLLQEIPRAMKKGRPIHVRVKVDDTETDLTVNVANAKQVHITEKRY